MIPHFLPSLGKFRAAVAYLPANLETSGTSSRFFRCQDPLRPEKLDRPASLTSDIQALLFRFAEPVRRRPLP